MSNLEVFFAKLKMLVSIKSGILKKLLMFAILTTLVVFGYNLASSYKNIKFTTFNEEDSPQIALEGDDYNLLIIGFEGSGENYFVDSLILASMNARTGSLKTLGLNPSFIVNYGIGKKYTLKSLWNNIEGETTNIFSKIVGDFLGVRVDGYIAFENEDLKELIKGWEFEMNDIEDYNKVLRGDSLNQYLFSESLNNDVKARKSLLFFNQTIERYRNITFYLKALQRAEELTQTFHTDLSNENMISFLQAVMTSNLPLKTLLIGENFGSLASTGVEEGLAVNLIEMDESITRTLGDLDIIREQAMIEIYNASSQSGLAGSSKRIFENMGSNVINTANYPETIEGIRLYIPHNNPDEFPFTIQLIKKYFGNKITIILGEYKYNYSGDLILVLGNEKE